MSILTDIYEAAGSELYLPGFKRKSEADAKAKVSSEGFVKDVYVYEFQDGTFVISSAKGQNGKIVSVFRDGKRTQLKTSVDSFDLRNAAGKDSRGFVGTNPSQSGLGSSAYAPYGKASIE